MVATVRKLSDCMAIMRRALSRPNENDPDSSDTILFQYIQDFIQLTMSDDVKLFEQFGSLKFTIDETHADGVYTFNDVGAADNFTNISQEAFIQLTDPPAGSISWNQLLIYQDPGSFFMMWGINNETVLIKGYPTMMLYYGNQMTFRTIPNTSYTVTIFGYKEVQPFSEDGDPDLPFAYWLRYVAYGAAANYARDFNFDSDILRGLINNFQHEKKLMLTRTHNQVKMSRSLPRF